MIDGTGAVIGGPRLLLRLEGVAVLALAVALYTRTGSSWWLFGTLLLAPDLAFLGYLGGPRLGAVAYNALHTYLGPAVVVAYCQGVGIGTSIALVWAAHIGMDRALGFGLKYASGFGITHLGAMGGGGSSRRTG